MNTMAATMEPAQSVARGFFPMRTIAVALALCCVTAHGEKVAFRDELTGCEMWRMSDYGTFHEYGHAAKPFSYDGRRIVCREWRPDGGIVVIDLAGGSETVFGREHRGWKENPAFVRGTNAVVYIAGRQDASIFLYDIDTAKERRVVKLEGDARMPCAGVIGPRSEYLLLRGDLNGDGLSDWGLKPLWTEEPARALCVSSNDCVHPHTVSPSPDCNRLTLGMQTCHPDVLRRVRRGERLTPQQLAVDSRYQACIAVVDFKTGSAKIYPAKNAKLWAHEAWSGDGEYLHMAGCSWRAGVDAPSVPIRIGDGEPSDHCGTCGRSGRYVVGDSSADGMERLELTDLWTGEMRTVAYISAPTEPAGKIDQDHGHPAGSPDGTKVLFHSCYDLVNHRLYAIPTQDIHAGDSVIPVETTEGFAPQGKLLIGHGYAGKRMTVSYQRADATHFHGCDWGTDAAARLNRAVKSDVIRKGSHQMTDALGRLFPDGTCRPRKDYIAVVKRPDPPRSLVAALVGEGVRLKWNPPASHEEIAGYIVWRRCGAGAMERLTPDSVSVCEFTDNKPPRQSKLEYSVQAVEYSGLHGDHSSVAWVEGSRAGANLADSYDVPGCAYVTPGEAPKSDRRRVHFSVPIEGRYALWARSRAHRDAETLRVRVDGEPLPDARIEGSDWIWAKVVSCQLGAGEHTLDLAREETCSIKEGNLLSNPGFEDGLKGWRCDETVTSVDDTLAHSGRRCIKLSGTLTDKKLFQAIDLEVKPEWSYRLSFWMRGKFTQSEAKRYNGPHPNTLGRFAMLLDPLPYPRDWFRDGNQFDEQWQRMDIVFDSPKQAPGSRPAKRIAAQPFWCPGFWGKQAGTVWIDDVSVTELGPRLRPVKVTKLLVTNVPGYVPKGLDGREACPLPRAPLIPVTGLHQAARAGDSITLAWDAGRLGTRGYNVYLNVGDDCPATKYFQKTSVWGQTAVKLGGLTPATSYAAKVFAINEDGIAGPATTIKAKTAP